MKKLFFGLLILAAGAVAFFSLQNKKQIIQQFPDQKELILGEWKMNSIEAPSDSNSHFFVGIMGMIDTNLMNYEYRFTKEGVVYRSLGDSVLKDSSLYHWNSADQFTWKENTSDSTGEVMKIIAISEDSLKLATTDHTIIVFAKLK